MHSIDGKSGKSGRRPWGKSGKSGASSGSSMKWPYDPCLSGKSGKSGYYSEGKSGKSGYYSEGKSGKSGRPSTHRMLKKKKKKKGPWGGKSGKSGAASTHKKYHLFPVSLFCCLLLQMICTCITCNHNRFNPPPMICLFYSPQNRNQKSLVHTRVDRVKVARAECGGLLLLPLLMLQP